jgi:hypothetical protein
MGARPNAVTTWWAAAQKHAAPYAHQSGYRIKSKRVARATFYGRPRSSQVSTSPGRHFLNPATHCTISADQLATMSIPNLQGCDSCQG